MRRAEKNSTVRNGLAYRTGKKGVVIGLVMAMIVSSIYPCMRSSAETDSDNLYTNPNPDDEFAEEEVIVFKDKQGLTYTTNDTAKSVYNLTSSIEVEIAEKDLNKVSGKIVIPASIVNPKTGKRYKVTDMSLGGFEHCKGITSVVLPASWKKWVSGFRGCENLKSVTIKASSVKLIDFAAFADCHKLTTIKNIQRVKKIGEMAFSECRSLKKLKLDQVVSIEDNAFQGCKKLNTITIGKKFKELGSLVFSRCKKLKIITIKSTKLKKVSKTAFKNTSQKITIKVPKKKLSAYKKLFKTKGNKKVVVRAA